MENKNDPYYPDGFETPIQQQCPLCGLTSIDGNPHLECVQYEEYEVNEAIELMAQDIMSIDSSTGWETSKEIAHSLLALTWKCPECKGEGYKYQDNSHEEVNQCLSCNGTGNLLKDGKPVPVLGVLAKDQSTPENPFKGKLASAEYYEGEGYHRTIQDMLKAGFRKVIL